MLKLKHQNIAGSMITVTDTSTIWSDLVNVAAGTTDRNAGFDTTKANGVNIIPLNGDIRFQEDGNDPTATEGQPLDENFIYGGRNMSLSNLRLIRNGASDVLCYIQPGTCNPHETSFITGAGGASGGDNSDLISDTVVHESVTMTSANTEYTYTLPADIKGFEMRLDIDSSEDFKLNYNGSVGASATDYITIEDGEMYWRGTLALPAGFVLRFQSPTASQTMKIVTYS